MPVVAVVLGKGLLEHHTPDCAIFADHSRPSAQISSFSLSKGQVIVDYDRVRDTKGVKIHAVDAVFAQLIFVVQEDLFYAARNRSECRGGGQIAAVANLALPDVVNSDAFATIEGFSGESVLCSLPYFLFCCPAVFECFPGIQP